MASMKSLFLVISDFLDFSQIQARKQIEINIQTFKVS